MSQEFQQSAPQSNGHAAEETLFQKICRTLNTNLNNAEDESPEDFKVRVVTEFSDMDRWPDDQYEKLDQEVQDWVFEATTTHKGNLNKKRKKTLPALPGLDHEASEKPSKRRVSLSEEPKRGRTRATGEDCLTRTMKLLVNSANPDKVKAQELKDELSAKYGKDYSTAAVRYAQQAFITARNLLRQNPTPMQQPSATQQPVA